VQVYDYGTGVRPYRYTVQPTLAFSTKGRRDVLLFIDAPHVGSWRVSADIAREVHLATPYYGIGNTSVFDTTADDVPNPYWYRYGRRRTRIAADVQRPIAALLLRALLGAGFVDVTTVPVPFDSGNTLFAQEWAQNGGPRGRLNYARLGLVWDTRDREIGPTRGVWAELLVQDVSPRYGATSAFRRLTGTARAYVPLHRRLTLAERLIVQQVNGGVPVFDLSTIQSSYKQQEGVGGNNTVRGVLKNRFVGNRIIVTNSELRWRVRDFQFRHRTAFLMASGFVDAGRVWNDDSWIDDLTQHYRTGYGAGLRVGLGPSFVVAVDVGHSSEATQLYIGLGYPF